MIKLNIIAVGKIKENDFDLAIKEYIKRLRAFCEPCIIEIKPALLPENPSAGQISAAIKAEAEQIRDKIPKSLSSEDFAEKIKICADEGKNICFIIGGSHGLDESIKNLGTAISFSEMTFPHRLFRVMLLEQVYRAFTIISGKKYHK